MKQRALIITLTATICADAAVFRMFNSSHGKDAPPPAGPYGTASCPCVGIDNVDGETTAQLKGGKTATYPRDIGARCKAWDANTHPKCPGEPWCDAKWCYVDPCNCEELATLPKPANYFPDSKYQGKQVHFSYATCDDMDSYTEDKDTRGAHEEIDAVCSAHVDSSKWGQENCRCIGVAPQPGHTKVDIEGKKVKFPADTGATCNQWEKDNHPECSGGSPPSWCNQAWCYVDPCRCTLETPPKTSSYLPEANYQGRPMYYSYATCGGTDSWTEGKHKSACVNQKSQEDCNKLSKCAWDGKNCLGKELVNVCSGTWSPKAFMALALPFFAFIH